MERTTLPTRNLDVLRATAVLCVLGAHLVVGLGLPERGWDSLGRFGVLLFFVHTSLVLMGSLERQRHQPNWVRGFYLRRAFRIYPLSCVIILIVVALRIPNEIPLFGMPPAGIVVTGIKPVLTNLLLVQNFTGSPDILAVLWTLPLEIQMYLTLPFCSSVARRGIVAAGLMMLLSLFAGWSWLTMAGVVRGLWRLSIVSYAPCFIAGTLAYAVLRMRPRARIPSIAWPVILVAFIAGWLWLGWDRSVIARYWQQWLLCMATGLVLPFVRELPASILTRAAEVVATYSYSIYLLHVPVFWFAFTQFQGRPRIFAIVVSAVLLPSLTWLAYHVIEKPGIELGRAFAARPRRVQVVAAAP